MAADAPPPPPGPVPVPAQDLVTSLPAPVLRLLILFARPITMLRGALEVLAWKPERRVESYLLIGAWWAACLGGEYAFMWLLPPLLFAPLLPLRRLRMPRKKTATPTPVQPTPAQPATSETLLATLGDLHKVLALLPPSPVPPLEAVYARFKQLGPRRLLRGLVVLWLMWLVLGRFLGLRILLAIVGSILLLLPSPLLAHTVHLLSRSLAVRRLVALQFVLIFGSPDRDYTFGSPLGWLRSKWAWSRRPETALMFQQTAKPAAEPDHAPADKAGNPIYFRFEVFENQRWWMGLDWTSALLPQERPSWCDVHLLPVSPPVAFTLPPSSSIDVPAPTAAEPRAQVRRMATWRWLDDDWTVYKNTGDGGAASSSATVSGARAQPVLNDDDAISLHSTTSEPQNAVSKPARPSSGMFGTSPDDSGHTRAPSMAEAAFAKGLGRLKNVAPGLSGPISPIKSTNPRARTGSEASTEQTAAPEDILAGAAPGPQGTPANRDEPTDADGWVYGDNKWENMGAKGGLGKFTRRRRWQRRAVCTETIHRIKELAASPPADDRTPSGETITPGTTPGARSVSGAAPLKPQPPQPSGLSVARKSVETRTTSPPPAIAPTPPQSGSSALTSRDEQLRLRLKKAMGSMGA